MPEPTKLQVIDENGQVMAVIDWPKLIELLIQIVKVLFGIG